MTMPKKEDLPATKGDIAALREELSGCAKKNDLEGFAKKDDLKQFATKDDLKQFATKDDLKQFATKDDLKRFATKDDLKSLSTKDDFKRLAIEITRTNVRIDTLQESLTAQFNQGISRILKVVEDFASQCQKVDRRQIIMDWRVDELDKRLKALEAR